ncbi:hypothetical protein [Rhizobium sp. LEGMi135b]
MLARLQQQGRHAVDRSYFPFANVCYRDVAPKKQLRVVFPDIDQWQAMNAGYGERDLAGIRGCLDFRGAGRTQHEGGSRRGGKLLVLRLNLKYAAFDEVQLYPIGRIKQIEDFITRFRKDFPSCHPSDCGQRDIDVEIRIVQPSFEDNRYVCVLQSFL